MKKFSASLFLPVMLLASCNPTGITVQGVTDDEIVIGNTAAVTGAYATVGLPFNDAMKIVFDSVNQSGGIDGRKIKFVTYDDGFDAAKGVEYTTKLVEEDQVFALVGHFGTPTVSATIDYLEEMGVPMVYAATGINQLYYEKDEGGNILAVQPIYKTDGRIMAARAVKTAVYNGAALGANDKVGVVYSNDDAGQSILEGVKQQLELLGYSGDKVVIEQIDALQTTNYATTVTKMKTAGVKTMIVASNQVPFGGFVKEMATQSLNVPTFTSYTNADVTVIDETTYSAERPIFANAWLDIVDANGVGGFTDSYWEFANAMIAAGKTDLAANSFAMAGWISAHVFIEGLNRVAKGEEELTFASYISAMESAPINIPMGGTVDFTDGKRWGIDSMSLSQYVYIPATDDTPAVETFIKVDGIKTIDEIVG